MIRLFTAFALCLLGTGCFEAHSDEATLSTVPATNNPSLIHDDGRAASIPGAGF